MYMNLLSKAMGGTGCTTTTEWPKPKSYEPDVDVSGIPDDAGRSMTAYKASKLRQYKAKRA